MSEELATGSADGSLRIPVVHVMRRKHRGEHPWIFSNEVRRVEGEPGHGGTVRVYERGQFVGSGIYNHHSLIRVRLYSRADEELDRRLIRERIEAAFRHRQQVLAGEEDYRLVYGESDGLPGLVIDRYGRHFVVQAYSAGFDQRLADVAAVLRELFDAASVFEKDDFQLREREGLERREGLVEGTMEPRVVVSENGASFSVDIAAGQKTGYYFDHRLTRRRVRELAHGRKVLDLFSYVGPFAINAALGMARQVTGVDSSGQAVALARENAGLNRVEQRCEFIQADVIEYLSALLRQGEQFDLVILDPPALIKSQREKAAGMRRYQFINRLAMQLVAPGGILVSCSCSYHLSWEDLRSVLNAAASSAGRSFVLVERVVQGPDHPVLLAMPESEYLRGFVLHASL